MNPAKPRPYQLQQELLRERLQQYLSELERAQHSVKDARRLNDLARELVELSRELHNNKRA